MRTLTAQPRAARGRDLAESRYCALFSSLLSVLKIDKSLNNKCYPTTIEGNSKINRKIVEFIRYWNRNQTSPLCGRVLPSILLQRWWGLRPTTLNVGGDRAGGAEELVPRNVAIVNWLIYAKLAPPFFGSRRPPAVPARAVSHIFLRVNECKSG